MVLPRRNGRTTTEWPNRGKSVGWRESGTGQTAKLIPVGVRTIPTVSPILGRRKTGMSIAFPVRRRPTVCSGRRRLMKGIQPVGNLGRQRFESIGGVLLEPKMSVGAWSVLPTQDWGCSKRESTERDLLTGSMATPITRCSAST